MFYKVFYTNFFIWPRSAATTWGPFIFIRPTKREEIGLLEHEKVHVAQFWRNPFKSLMYWFSREVRLEHEVEAFRVSVKYHPDRLSRFATSLSTKYRLNITYDEAVKLLNAT